MSAADPKLSYLFAVPLLHHDLAEPDELCASLSELFLACEADPEAYRNRIRRDTQKGELFESRFDLFDWDHPAVRRLAQHCDALLRATVAKTSEFAPQQLEQLQIDYHAWFHVTREGGYQGLHNHSNASWSGIFCVDPGDPVPGRPESGAVRFHDTRANANYYADAGNARLRMPMHIGSFQIEHAVGRTWLFPSYLLHEVLPYLGQRPRIVVAFNAWMRFDHGA